MKIEDYKLIEQKVLKRLKVNSRRELQNDVELINEFEKHSTLIGLTGIKDTLKSGVKETLRQLKKSGI
jgi:magnesium-transporting ATPase (P-type)